MLYGALKPLVGLLFGGGGGNCNPTVSN